jgi:hypothetical protein
MPRGAAVGPQPSIDNRDASPVRSFRLKNELIWEAFPAFQAVGMLENLPSVVRHGIAAAPFALASLRTGSDRREFLGSVRQRTPRLYRFLQYMRQLADQPNTSLAEFVFELSEQAGQLEQLISDMLVYEALPLRKATQYYERSWFILLVQFARQTPWFVPDEAALELNWYALRDLLEPHIPEIEKIDRKVLGNKDNVYVDVLRAVRDGVEDNYQIPIKLTAPTGD